MSWLNRWVGPTCPVTVCGFAETGRYSFSLLHPFCCWYDSSCMKLFHQCFCISLYLHIWNTVVGILKSINKSSMNFCVHLKPTEIKYFTVNFKQKLNLVLKTITYYQQEKCHNPRRYRGHYFPNEVSLFYEKNQIRD